MEQFAIAISLVAGPLPNVPSVVRPLLDTLSMSLAFFTPLALIHSLILQFHRRIELTLFNDLSVYIISHYGISHAFFFLFGSKLGLLLAFQIFLDSLIDIIFNI